MQKSMEDKRQHKILRVPSTSDVRLWFAIPLARCGIKIWDLLGLGSTPRSGCVHIFSEWRGTWKRNNLSGWVDSVPLRGSVPQLNQKTISKGSSKHPRQRTRKSIQDFKKHLLHAKAFKLICQEMGRCMTGIS